MMYAKFNTDRLDQDPEFCRLLLEFANAKMNLSSYLNEHLDLSLSFENEKAGEVIPQH